MNTVTASVTGSVTEITFEWFKKNVLDNPNAYLYHKDVWNYTYSNAWSDIHEFGSGTTRYDDIATICNKPFRYIHHRVVTEDELCGLHVYQYLIFESEKDKLEFILKGTK